MFGVSGIGISIALYILIASEAFGRDSWSMLETVSSISLGWAVATLIMVGLGVGAMMHILVIAQTAPLLSGEIELQSWDLLRTTSLPLREIILAKFAAALATLRAPLYGLLTLRFAAIASIALLLGAGLMQNEFSYMGRDEWRLFWLELRWLPPVLGGLVVALVLLVQPLVEFVLNGSLGLLASAMSRSRGQAIAVGLATRLALWLAGVLGHIVIGGGLIAIYSEWVDRRYSSIDAYSILGSTTVLEEMWVLAILIIGYALALTAISVGLTLVSTGIALRRMRNPRG